MSFVQILEYETDKPDEVAELAVGRMAAAPSLPPGLRVLVTQDRDNPRRFVTIIEFPSAELAAQMLSQNNSAEFIGRMAPLCTAGPTFSQLDVTQTIG